MRLPLVSLLLSLTSMLHGAGAEERIELVRDRWGIPHVFADSDAGAMFGLGYASAEDRGFQMLLNLRVIQGRLAELVGNIPKLRRNKGDAIRSDRKMRTFGWARAAREAARNLDRPVHALLLAYSRGVNHYFATHRATLPPLFARYGIQAVHWTPADCILSWWHLAQFFATDGTRDLISYRNLKRGRRGPRVRPPADPQAAVISRSDVSPRWLEETWAFVAQRLLPRPEGAHGARAPKWSHAWVVGGRRSTTGSAILCSDPQTPVRNPSLLYEFHVKGQTFNARGVGVAGSPIVLIGWTPYVAWGMTALGADQADLFRLKTRGDTYLHDGVYKQMRVRHETIAVRGGAPRRLRIRETHHGPIVSEFAFARPGEGEVALRRIPICETERETIEGALAMLRARDVDGFARALPGWRFPSANVVFGDRRGRIGYWTLAAIPIRAATSALWGRAAHDGTASRHEWQGVVPHRLLPHVIDPKSGYLASANNRPIGPYYPIPLGTSTGSGGDTIRSWRLRELLSARTRFTPEQVLAVHHDTVNPARREIVRIGLHIRDTLEQPLSPSAVAALELLGPWHRTGARSDLRSTGAALAGELDLFFRFTSTQLTQTWGGGGAGLTRFLRAVARRLQANPRAPIAPVERRFVDRTLANAWASATAKYGSDFGRWDSLARAAVKRRRLGYQQGLDGFGSLDPAHDLFSPALRCVDGNTILSQAGQSYSQWVPLHDVDRARSILPIGLSERPGHASRTSGMAGWSTAKMHPAPITRAGVRAVQVSVTRLSFRPDR